MHRTSAAKATSENKAFNAALEALLTQNQAFSAASGTPRSSPITKGFSLPTKVEILLTFGVKNENFRPFCVGL